MTYSQPQHNPGIRISKMNFKTAIVTILNEVKKNMMVMNKKTGSDHRQIKIIKKNQMESL